MARRFFPVTILAGVLVLLLVGVATVWGTYNRLVGLDQKVKEAWAQVDNVLQRRNDLIPNLVATVRGYAKHEREVFTKVTEARSALMAARTVSDKSAAAARLDSWIARLLVVVENYPQLKANESFLRLQDELAGTENRISVERKSYNAAVNAYNTSARGFPTVVLAGALGFEREKPYFQATEGSAAPPKVEFE